MKKVYLIFILFFFVLFSCEDDPGATLSSTSELSDSSGGSFVGSGSGGSTGGGGGGDSTSLPTTGGQITAGEWNALDNWGFWNDLLTHDAVVDFRTYWKYEMTDRIAVHVTNPSGISLMNIKVDLLDTNDQVI